MTIDIFIASIPRDYTFLHYCIRSIKKYVTGYRKIHVVIPPWAHPTRPKDLALPVEWHTEVSGVGLGYITKQATVIRAYSYTDAEYIMFLACDHIARESVDIVRDYFEDGKPQLWYRTFDAVRRLSPDAIGINSMAAKWQMPAMNALGFECPYFTLEFQPIVHHRSTVLGAAARMEQVTRRSVEAYANSLMYPGFGEYLVLGNYAMLRNSALYTMKESDPSYRYKFYGYLSYDGVSQELRDDFEELLK